MMFEEKMTGDMAGALAAQLLGERGNALSLDASQVARIDTPIVEVLMSAAKLWNEDGVGLEYQTISDPMTNALKLLGLSQSDIQSGQTAKETQNVG